jgi:hypothetical protein
VIVAQEHSDRASVARFVERHEVPLAELLGDVLALCAGVGLAGVGLIAVDGAEVAANASRDRILGYAQIAEAIVAEAIQTDRVETAEHGLLRGDELPAVAASARGDGPVVARRGATPRGPARRAGAADQA